MREKNKIFVWATEIQKEIYQLPVQVILYVLFLRLRNRITLKFPLFPDAKTQENFIKFYNELDEKPATTIRVFDRGGEFYSCHGPDADLAAKIVFKSSSVIKIMCPDNDKTTSLKYVCFAGQKILSII